MTAGELFALPDDSHAERWLIRGELRERCGSGHSPDHAGAVATLCGLLGEWRAARARPSPRVYSHACFRLETEPDSVIPLDVAVVTRELTDRTPRKAWFFDGPPLLAIDVLEPGELPGAAERTAWYRIVPLVWVVDPVLRTVTVCRQGAEPELFNIRQELNGDPHLPGFRCRVAEIFED